MVKHLDHATVTGAHPTTGEFVEHLHAWGFTQRKIDGVHIVFRGPNGGTVRVVRSLLGRVDATLVDKAARLVEITTEQFWAGPPPAEVTTPMTTPSSTPARRRRPARRDRVISLVLTAHTQTDRPLGFDQVVELCRNQVTREQVSSASAVLCRDGDLDRIRSGVYQWSGGQRAVLPTATPSAKAPVVRLDPAPPQPVPAPAVRMSAVELFDYLFPRGVRMTSELLSDVERWKLLTEKLIAYAEAS